MELTVDYQLERAFDRADAYLEQRLKTEATRTQQQLKASRRKPQPSPLQRLLTERKQR
jgi:hypothetical protein